MVCSNQPTDGGRSPQAGRATLASHQARAGLGRAEGIPNALSHYSRDPIKQILPINYGQPHELSPYEKPYGFWVSVDGADDWPSWCMAEQYQTEHLAHKYTVHLSDAASIAMLSSPSCFDRFEGAYGRDPHNCGMRDRLCIDWRAVADDYDGIIIAPYQWSERMSRSWYYGWDCASGCLWNHDVFLLSAAQRIEARSDETLQAARPEGQEPDGEADAPNPNQEQSQ